ncbi:MAG: hypothetical protein R8N23_18635 [Reichenbachiella sp.]|uniref:hypothetical protein n=1 Tax=Reichenbachiella sp. TaxID=2184521 RepID=UPI002966622C|nr:hypothetical protein [Reichenbachiella sp.]MDW3211894.1 hypothetical protein [Reichenbachiella sp.]
MKYLFEGDNFGFTKQELHLFGGNYGFRKIDLTQVSKIYVYKGMLTKYPILTSIFGLCSIALVTYGLYWALNGMGNSVDLSELNGRGVRGTGALLLGLGFVFLAGERAFSLILVKRFILKVEFYDRNFELRSLKSLEKNNSLLRFIDFLMKKYPPQKLRIEANILEELKK